jgi:ribose transport system substrate-binding protein
MQRRSSSRQKPSWRSLLLAFAVLVAVSMVAAACGGDDETGGGGPTGTATEGGGEAASPEVEEALTKVNTVLDGLKSEAGSTSEIQSEWPEPVDSPCSDPEPKEPGELKVGYAYASRANPWQVQNAIGGTWFLENHPDIAEVLTTDGQENPSKQISDIESLIAQGIDVLIVNPTTTAVSPAVAQACQRGITTVVYDRFVTEGTPVTASMYANEVQDGYNGGQAIVEALNGPGNVVIIPGIAGAGVTEDRVKGARMAMAEAPGIKILGLAYSDWDPAKGRRIMEQFLTRHNKIDAVWSDSGVQAVGIIQALQAANRLDEVKMIVGGQLNGFLKQWDELGFQGYGSTISTDVGILASQLGLDIATGRYTPEANVPAPLVVIDQESLDEFVRTDLPDSYWATEVLPNSVLDEIFQAQ